MRPYCSRLVALSSMVRPELREESVESMLDTASASAGRDLGAVICHLESLRCKRTVSPERRLISISCNWSSGMPTSFVVVLSVGAFSALAALLFDHQRTPVRRIEGKCACTSPLDVLR